MRFGTDALVPDAPVLVSEVEWGVRALGAVTLEDLVYRRLRTAWYVPSAREAAVVPAAERMGKLLGWSAERQQSEIARVRERLASELAFLAE
jgi:glycerol-3-phosphate dehydrogenase